MRIALDYDDTYTADSLLWLAFIKDATQRGHEVIVVTMRYPEEMRGIDPALRDLGIQMFPTSRQAKADYLQAIGEKPPAIWIDDNPRWIHTSALQTSIQATLEAAAAEGLKARSMLNDKSA